MAEENKTTKEAKEEKVEEVKKQEIKPEEKVDKIEEKKLEKKEKAKQEKPKPKKSEALAFGRDAGISTKHAIAICNAIRGRKIDDAIALMENVVKKKRAIAMKGEIPHRKRESEGKKIMAGRYPVKAASFFVKLIKSLRANAENVSIDTDIARIYFANANLASRPHKRFGSERFKRTHVLLKLKEPKTEDKK